MRSTPPRLPRPSRSPILTSTRSKSSWNGVAFKSGTEVSAEGDHLLWVHATDKAGNESEETVTFEIRQAVRPTFRFAVCAIDSVLIEDSAGTAGYDWTRHQATLDGDLAAGGNVVMQEYAKVKGDIVAGKDLDIRNHTEVFGDVYLAGCLKVKPPAKVDGQVHHLSVPPTPCECGYDLAGTLAYRAQVNDNTKLLADPNIAPHIQNGSLVLGCRDRVALPSGAFYFRSVELHGNARLSVASGASAELYIKNGIQMEYGAELSNVPARAKDLLVVLGSGSRCGGPGPVSSITLNSDVDLGLYLYAPKADLLYTGAANLYGGLVVHSFHSENHGTVFVDDLLTSNPPAMSCE